jgi:radical SAM protein, TIGR01212 family
MMKQSYYSFSEYLRERFNCRVQRISINAGFNCPNRDGTLAGGGCIFCNEKGFTRFPGTTLSLQEQIASSITYARQRFKAEKFIAYFQNASNTYADPRRLREVYDIIREFPDIAGLFISTRPDCIDEDKLDVIESYAADYEVWIEYGLQTIHEKSLVALNRRHTYAQFQRAVAATARRKIKIGSHVILGIPGETGEEMMLTARAVAALPVAAVKLHNFHILSDTPAQRLYEQGRIILPGEADYVRLACDFLEYLNPECVIMRLVSSARPDILIAPQWMNQKQKVLDAIEREFQRRGTRQGSRYESKE